jgi:hypothetical protein
MNLNPLVGWNMNIGSGNCLNGIVDKGIDLNNIKFSDVDVIITNVTFVFSRLLLLSHQCWWLGQKFFQVYIRIGWRSRKNKLDNNKSYGNSIDMWFMTSLKFTYLLWYLIHHCFFLWSTRTTKNLPFKSCR